jgi:2-dehydropantoate 2-reductase
MRVWSVGAGAVGGTVAARLARCGIEPVVVDANRDHVLRIRYPGLHVDGGVTPLAAYTPDDPGEDLDDPPDVVLLAVRSDATTDALQPLVPRLREDTDVVSLQNGLNEERIAAVVGPDRTVGCVVGFGATWIAAGHVSVDAEGDLQIGRLDGSSDERLERVRALLGNAFPTRITTNVLGALWGKMLVNSMTVMGALGGMLVGELLDTPERRRVVAGVIAEGVDVATASGVRLPRVLGTVEAARVRDDVAMDAALRAFGERFGAIRSVTWRDFELGRRTEVDAVTGEIVRRGDALCVPVPLSAAVYGMLKEIEAGGRRIDPSNLDALDALADTA